ncbi:LOW QUALITY PROTEIN: FYVE, RhoGEF and PH domain-containing protein 5b [Pholidichthys leucotaenia]
MNTDCTKSSVAPKTRFVCHATLPVLRMSAAKGPKPSIAPKPRITSELNGNQRGCRNGSLPTSDGEAEEETEDGLNKVIMDTLPSKEQFHSHLLKSPQTDLHKRGSKDGEVTEEKKEEEEEEDMILKMDENWKLNNSGLTEETDSLGTPWVSDTLTADSEEAEMMDTDVMEDMDAEGCDAGEALADTDGLSVGDLFVNSIDEEGSCFSSDNGDVKEDHQQLQIKEEASTADDVTESLTEEPCLLVKENIGDSESKHAVMSDDDKEEGESAYDCGFTCNILKLRCGHKMKEKGESQQNICFYDFSPEDQKQVHDAVKRHAALEGDPGYEPFYVCSEDFVNRELMQESSVFSGSISALKKSDDKCVGSKNYSSNNPENKVRTCQKSTSVKAEGRSDNLVEAVLNHSDCQQDFRQDTDSSLTSSFSESQTLSPNDSDVFRDEDDLEGHIVPFLDGTTDTEQNITDENLYEEPGQSLEAEHIFPCYRKASEIRSCSLSHRITDNLDDDGVPFIPKSYFSGFGQPALSSSPMLGSTRQKSYPKPHYLSLYPRSLSMEGQDSPMCVYREGSPKQSGALCSSEIFSRGSPLSCSTLSTPTSVVDIPPPFELAYITKKPITKSSPSLLFEGDLSEKNNKKKSSIKRFLMLKFRWKAENKSMVDVNSSSFKSSVESTHRAPTRLLDLNTSSRNSSPQLISRSASKSQVSSEPKPTFMFHKETKRTGNSMAFLNRSVVRVESFEDRSRVPFIPLPLTKPRSISFPNTDTSDYENVPPISSDYENIQVPQRRPVLQVPLTEFFDRPSRAIFSASETDGYVDMSSLPGFEKKTQSPEEERESAYTEAYNVCSVAVGPVSGSVGEVGDSGGEEDQGRTSEEEEGGTENNYDRQPGGRSRAFYIVKELVDTERLLMPSTPIHVSDFREAVGSTVGEDGEPAVHDERLREILNELPDVYILHRAILTELENQIQHWEDTQNIADIFLSRKAEFLVFTTYIGHYDRSMSLLDDSRRASPSFAAVAQQFESPAGERASLKHQFLQVIVRVAQYRMLLTDYLNNLSPDSKEYEDTQAAVAMVSDIADQVNDSLKHGENLLRLINIEYSVRGLGALLQPGRVFVKEGNLMKVSRKSRQPRHLFLMNDVLIYTYPQQDGKYRLKNTLSLTGLKVSKPIIENVQNVLKIEVADISITLCASSFIEREDWFYTLNRTVTEHTRGPVALSSLSREGRDRLRLTLGEKAPTLVPVSQVMMCMNCTSDFSLTLRRHHCHGCGRIVCRSCSRNRYPLKYMKGRMAKVCDHCYNELKKRGGDVSALPGKSSPRVNRSSRPLSTVFQNIHPPNIWRHKKGTMSFTHVMVSEEGSVSGSLQRSKKSKRNWKRLWFLLKDKVLYTYRGQEEKVASESLPLLGFTVKLPDKLEGDDEANVFQLYHKNTLYYSFKAEDNYTAQRWANAMEEATVL